MVSCIVAVFKSEISCVSDYGNEIENGLNASVHVVEAVISTSRKRGFESLGDAALGQGGGELKIRQTMQDFQGILVEHA